MKWTIFLDFVHYRIGTLWTNQKQCAIVHLENISSEYWIISSWVSTSHIESEVCVPTREKKHETGLLPHLATSKSSGSSRGEDKNLEKWCMDIILAQKCPRTWKYQKKPWKIDNVVVIHTTYVITSS